MAALKAGASAYFREAMTSQTLVRGLKLVLENEIVLPPEVVNVLSGYSAPSEPKEKEQQAYNSNFNGELPTLARCAKEAQLSAREARILQALVEGASNKLIAKNLQITEATVKVHVAALLRKIRVKNRTQAAVWAMKNPNKS